MFLSISNCMRSEHDKTEHRTKSNVILSPEEVRFKQVSLYLI